MLFPALSKRALRSPKWSDHFSGATVSDLTPQAQEAFIAGFAGSMGTSLLHLKDSIRRSRRAMRAWKRGELASVPFIADVERDPEQEAERFRDLSMDEVVRLLRAAAATPSSADLLHD